MSRQLTFVAMLAVGLAGSACNREANEVRNETAEVTREADRAAELKRQRDDEIARLDERVAEIERDYAEAKGKVASGSRSATAGLREELQEDVTNVRQAINNLRDTTAENWWDRHEAAMRQTADDIEADVKRLAGSAMPRRPADTTRTNTAGTTGDAASTAPFTSRRDQFVASLRARVDAMDDALEGVKARDARETELEDTRARVRKLGDDLDRLGSASADDWWDVTKARVSEYVDRVENSVERLDDDRK